MDNLWGRALTTFSYLWGGTTTDFRLLPPRWGIENLSQIGS